MYHKSIFLETYLVRDMRKDSKEKELGRWVGLWLLVVGEGRSFLVETKAWIKSWKKENSKHLLGSARGIGCSSVTV